ncbi:hypothetical protein DZC73_21670 [Albitalea terrae]|uniref:Uncharacterized protein n=2 Tax=Piscinibacter terrae TaxID=2496871 RepID=A0A3N7HLB5_9BURK|nr:hypothetical protein DZC73_21670 [Albitalea terrae]
MGRMARDEQHTWGRESRRDGNSEWPSTSFHQTTIGEARDLRPMRVPRRHKKSSYLSLALPILLVLSLGFIGLLSLAQHFRG